MSIIMIVFLLGFPLWGLLALNLWDWMEMRWNKGKPDHLAEIIEIAIRAAMKDKHNAE
jgi:hypothetical protein